MSTAVYIIISQPRYGNFYHWALYVADQTPRVYEMAGEHPSFSYHYYEADPTLSKDHKETIIVGYVSNVDLAELHEVMPRMPIDNGNPGWTCQDWVLESLEELCSQGFMDVDDEDYRVGVERAKRRYFGPK